MGHVVSSFAKALPRVILEYFSWMIRYGGKNRSKYPLVKRYNALRNTVLFINKKFNMVLHVEGEENIPKEVSVFFPNHISGYDPLLLISAIDKPTAFLAKKETKKIIAVPKCINAIDGLYIDREDLKQSLRIMMEIQKDLKAKNKNWVIFPEGTRRKDGMRTIREFHHGTFRSAMKAEVPIVPVALVGSNNLLKNHPKYQKYHVFIKFLKPIYPDEYKNMSTQEIAKIAQDIVDQTYTFDLIPKLHKELLNEKDYRFNKLNY